MVLLALIIFINTKLPLIGTQLTVASVGRVLGSSLVPRLLPMPKYGEESLGTRARLGGGGAFLKIFRHACVHCLITSSSISSACCGRAPVSCVLKEPYGPEFH